MSGEKTKSLVSILEAMKEKGIKLDINAIKEINRDVKLIKSNGEKRWKTLTEICTPEALAHVNKEDFLIGYEEGSLDVGLKFDSVKKILKEALVDLEAAKYHTMMSQATASPEHIHEEIKDGMRSIEKVLEMNLFESKEDEHEESKSLHKD